MGGGREAARPRCVFESPAVHAMRRINRGDTKDTKETRKVESCYGVCRCRTRRLCGWSGAPRSGGSPPPGPSTRCWSSSLMSWKSLDSPIRISGRLRSLHPCSMTARRTVLECLHAVSAFEDEADAALQQRSATWINDARRPRRTPGG